MSAFTNYHKDHSISAEMGFVHQKMQAKFKLDAAARQDIKRASMMEKYLRKFKALGDKYQKDSEKPRYQLSLEDQAIETVADQVGVALGLGQKAGNSLFRWTHKMGQSTDIRGVDDIFEAELAKLLEIAAKEASGNLSVESGVQVIGQVTGNISKSLMEELNKHKNEIIQNNSLSSELIEAPTARSGKVDVSGYSTEFVIESQIKPEWSEFIQLFKGAKMTLKNYSSNNVQYTSIHLGKTVPQKAILGSLSYLNFSDEQAVHIYSHLLQEKSIKMEGHHIIHLRFQYELTGGGLYTADGQNTPLDSADFFVYNDPSSSNIWVRSTKAMIAEMNKYSTQTGDPLHSTIIVVKNSFT